MLGYAKLYRDRIRAEAAEEVYRELQQAVKEGKTIEEFLETKNKKKNGKIDSSSTTKKKSN